jgi:hypothetical protein
MSLHELPGPNARLTLFAAGSYTEIVVVGFPNFKEFPAKESSNMRKSVYVAVAATALLPLHLGSATAAEVEVSIAGDLVNI